MNFIDRLMRRFTIRLRMMGAIAMVVLLLVMLGGIGLFGMYRIQTVSEELANRTLTVNDRLATLVHHMDQLRRHEKDLVINYEKPEVITAIKARWLESLRLSQVEIKALAGAEHQLDPKTAEIVATRVQAYATAFAPVLKQIEASAYDSATAVNKVTLRAVNEIMEAEKAVNTLRDDNTRQARATREGMQYSTRVIFYAFGGAMAVAMLLVVPLTIANFGSILRPIDRANALARSIASGNLTSRVEENGRDETADLMRGLDSMQTQLRALVGQVREASDSIAISSSEIASGNQDLSQRTEQTASNLQQTSSSMMQLTGTVRQSADSARQANQLASSAAEVAARGGTVVSQVVTTMNEINVSSKKIADIIGVIDGIAFQTNILALNAAVEAARAGEQGRGFAVVAAEVRSLAGRSADAAKEIKGLIGVSVDRVEAGSRLVADAGITMAEIVSSVQRVTDIIGEITAASAEQSDGIGLVNNSITHLDQMTQQNAALVEESAAAAESLKQQAGSLTKVVGTFRLAVNA